MTPPHTPPVTTKAGFLRPEVLDDVVVADDVDTALAGLTARLGIAFGDKLRD